MMSMVYQHANIIATHVLAEVKVVKKDIIQAMEEQQPDENRPQNSILIVQ